MYTSRDISKRNEKKYLGYEKAKESSCFRNLSVVNTQIPLRVEERWHPRTNAQMAPRRLCSQVQSIVSFYTLKPQGEVDKQVRFYRHICSSQQVVKGNDSLFQLLLQVASEIMLGKQVI